MSANESEGGTVGYSVDIHFELLVLLYQILCFIKNVRCLTSSNEPVACDRALNFNTLNFNDF